MDRITEPRFQWFFLYFVQLNDQASCSFASIILQTLAAYGTNQYTVMFICNTDRVKEILVKE